MTRFLLAGMSPQTASAVELLVGSVFGAVTLVRHDRATTLTPATLAPQLRPNDLLVLDLMGLGWPLCTPARLQSLCRDLLGPRPAVLMLPPEPPPAAGQGGWAAALAHSNQGAAPPVCVPSPASLSTMRDALQQLQARLSRHTASQPLRPTAATTATATFTAAPLATPMAPTVNPTVASAVAAAAQATATATATAPRRVVPALDAWSWPDSQPPFADTAPGSAPLQPMPDLTAAVAAAAVPVPAASPSPAAAVMAAAVASAARPRASTRRVQPFALTGDAYAAIRAACPAIGANPFLALVFNVVLQGRPLAFHVGKQTGAVFHPAQNWVASNISTALRKRLTQHRLMLEIAEVQPLAEDQVLDHARPLYGRRDDGRRALDSFIWALVQHTFDEAPPALDGSLTFHLRRLPNFTRLPAVPDSFLQMALLCLRGPQTVASLRHAYPGLAPGRTDLFVLCALLSGLAELRPTHTRFPAAETRSAAPSPDGRSAAAPRRSFIRSLLAKLF